MLMADKAKQKDYGYATSGEKITDELIQQWADEAEAGYELTHLRPRGRPRMGDLPAKYFPVRLDPELRDALDPRAAKERNRPLRSSARRFAPTRLTRVERGVRLVGPT
jgi:hypothetical protein